MKTEPRPPEPMDLARRQQFAFERFLKSMSFGQARKTTRAGYYGAGYADGYRERDVEVATLIDIAERKARERIISELTSYAGRPIPEAADLDEKRDIRYRRKGVRDAIAWLWERGRAEAA